MAKQKEVKTNAMRILESLKIPYTHHTYECEEFVDGLQIADKLSLPYEQVYKTLVLSLIHILLFCYFFDKSIAKQISLC